MIQLVADFVDGFVQKVSFERNPQISFVSGDERRVAGRGEVALQKTAADFTIPDIGPFFEKRDVFRSHRRLPECTIGRVLKRTHHTGDITQSRSLQFSLAERARRFAFEIEENKIASGMKRLSKMKIAMNADLVRGRTLLEQTPLPLQNLLLCREHFLGFHAKRVRQVLDFFSK